MGQLCILRVETKKKFLLAETFNFISHRNPTPEGSEGEKWAPTNEFPLDYLQIGNENGHSKVLLTMKKDLFNDRAEFWENLSAHNPAADATASKPLMKGEL